MKRCTQTAATLLCALMLAFGWAGTARAQGSVTGAISGRVTSTEGEALAGAQVTIRNQSTGFVRTVVTRADGRYRVPALPVGGPYSVSASTVGRALGTQRNLQVALGADLTVDLQLSAAAVTLEGITATADANPVLSSTTKGLATSISEEAVERLPTLNRNFTDFVRLAPQVSSTGPGLSGGGVNNRFNNIQIDGASENDLFGLGTTGQPGGQAGGKSISIESVKEYQILLSPFDVRQGNFAGLLVNAVTKSGTNQLDGSAYYYTRNESLVREQTYINDFEQTQYGFSLGGPIIRDRLHFFVNPEWQQRTTPAGGPYLGQASTSTSLVPTAETINTFTQILQGYNINPGSAGLVNNDNPLNNVFGRLDLALPEIGSRFVIRHNYGRAEDNIFSRSNSVFSLQGNGYFFESTKHATVGQLFTTFTPNLYNELIVGYNTISDSRTPNVLAPQILVENGTQDLRAGGEASSQGNTLDQRIFEFTNNLSWQRGSHRFDIGAKNEWYHLDNFFAQNSLGAYEFANLDSLRAGRPSSYTLAANAADPKAALPHAAFDAAQFGAYLQDTWEPSERFSLTFGLRGDMPIVRDKPANTAIVETTFGRRTDNIPSGNIQWSPRIGFNWDVTGDNSTQIRGGTGVFVGRPAFVMIGNAFQNNGTGIALLTCGGSTGRPTPAFNPDPNNQPQACGNGQGLANGIIGQVNLLDEDLKFPASFRGSLAIDREIADGLVFSLEGLYTHAVEQFFYTDVNLANPDGVGVDARGRTVFGAIAATGVSTANRKSTSFTQVVDVTNQNKDYAYNLTAGLRRNFARGIDLQAFYTYSRARDVISATSSTAQSQYRFGRVNSGTLTNQKLGISSFDLPHKITVAGLYTFPWERFATSLSMTYNGQTGDPFTYVYGGASGRGDLNADGLQGNDAIYVPTSATDPTQIQFRDITTGSGANTVVTASAARQAAAFESFIQSSKCLREHRGQILERNTCRNGWTNYLDMSLRQSVPTIRGQNFSLQLDAFNFLNLLNREWGLVRSASSQSTSNLLTHVASTGADFRTSQPIVQFNPDFQQFFTESLGSNYQLQLSVRYSF